MSVPLLPRHAPSWRILLALTVAVTAAHIWLLAPSSEVFTPRPSVWQVRWIASPRLAQAVTTQITTSVATKTTPAHKQTLIRALAPTRPPVSISVTAHNKSHVLSPALPELLPRHPLGAASVAATDTAATGTANIVSASATDIAPAPIRLPPAVTLHYQVTGSRRGEPMEGESILTWSPDGTAYRAAWALDSPQLGRRSQTSEGTLQASGLAPERYGERQRSERAAHFDPAGQRVRFSANTPDAPWQPGMQDRLSALLQLAALLAAAPQRYPAGNVIRLPTTGVRDAADALWHVEDDQTLDIAGQAVLCVKLRRDPVGPYDNSIELWLTRNHDYLPARLLVTRFNGDTLNQILDKLPERN